jgi:hypothetical protein
MKIIYSELNEAKELNENRTTQKNGTLLQQELILRLHENYKREKVDFQLTIEAILWCLEFNMSFEAFFIFCDSVPCTFYKEMLSKNQSVKIHRASIIEGSMKYLNNLCSSMFKFLKQLSHHYQLRENFDMDALEELFPEIPLKQKSIFLGTLNKPAEVLSSILSVTREEELLVNISKQSFRNYKFKLIDTISENVIKNSDKTPDWILSDENIKTIVSNLTDFRVSERKLRDFRSLFKTYISDDNPLQIAKHSYHTRNKVGPRADLMHADGFGKYNSICDVSTLK